MKKTQKSVRKLTLARETLHLMNDTNLDQAAGGNLGTMSCFQCQLTDCCNTN